MSDKPKGMILNPSSRHLRLPSYQSLPVSLSSYNTEQNSIFRTIINKGKKLISSVSKSLFSFGFSRYLTESSDINENPLQENKTKETPCFKEKEEDLFVVGIKRPGKQFENCRKKRFTFNNIEVQTDIPYIPDCLDLKKEKMKKIQKKNDSAEELDTKGTDEDDDEVAKNPKGRNVRRSMKKKIGNVRIKTKKLSVYCLVIVIKFEIPINFLKNHQKVFRFLIVFQKKFWIRHKIL